MNDTNEYTPGFAGKQYRVIPTPTPSPKAAAANDAVNEVCADSVLNRGYTGRPPLKPYEDSTSKKSRLLPFAAKISEGLDGAMTLSRLNDSVIAGILTNTEANQIARSLGLDKQS
jgi:hypothetical protein